MVLQSATLKILSNTEQKRQKEGEIKHTDCYSMWELNMELCFRPIIPKLVENQALH